jgi:translation elongation factor EF-1beta
MENTRMRMIPIRLAIAAAALLALAACSDVQGGVDKVRDCTSLVEAVSNVNLNPAASPADIENDVEELKRKVDELRHPEVKAAAEALRDDVDRFQSAVRAANPSAANQAVRDVRQSAENVARSCNVPVDDLLGTG